MALVLMATHPWGTLWDDEGNVRIAQQASFTTRVGATAVTHYADAAGTGSSTGPVTSDSRGRLMRYVEEGSYNQTINGETLPVEAVAGASLTSVDGRVDVVEDRLAEAIRPLPTKNPRLGFDGMKLRGGNIMVESGAVAPYVETWQTFWNVWNWAGLIQPQIDDAIKLGMNPIRIIGSVRDVTGSAASLDAYLAHWDQVIDYCASRGVYVYVCGGEHSQAGAATVSDIATGLAALCAHVEDKWNVIGIDLLQEVNAWWQVELTPEATVLANLLTISTATQAAAPNLPQTYSRSVFNTGTAGTGINYTGLNTTLGSLLDFVDLHVYYTPTAADMDTFYAANARPVIFGEFGIAISETSADRTARFTAVRTLVLDARHGGALAWSVWDNFSGVDPTTKYGMYSDTVGTRRTDVTAVFDDFPSSFVEKRTVRLGDAQPAIRAYKSTTTAVTTATVTDVGLDTERWDTHGFHDLAISNIFTVPPGLGGKYLIIAHVRWETNAVGFRELWIADYVTGAIYSRATHPANTDAAGITCQTVSTVADLVPGDSIRMNVRQSSGGNLNLSASNGTTIRDGTELEMIRLSA